MYLYDFNKLWDENKLCVTHAHSILVILREMSGSVRFVAILPIRSTVSCL